MGATLFPVSVKSLSSCLSHFVPRCAPTRFCENSQALRLFLSRRNFSITCLCTGPPSAAIKQDPNAWSALWTWKSRMTISSFGLTSGGAAAGFALLVIMSCWYTIFQTSPPFWADRVAAHTRIPSARSVSAALEVIGSISEHSSPSGNFPVLTSSEHCRKTLGPESSPPQNMRRPRIPKSHCVWFVVLRSSHMSTEKVSKQTNEYFNWKCSQQLP